MFGISAYAQTPYASTVEQLPSDISFVYETAAVADAASAGGTFNIEVNESATVADTVEASLLVVSNVAESATATDATNYNNVYIVEIAESAAGADGFSSVLLSLSFLVVGGGGGGRAIS